jgi:tetratricopeptide (TPR) repeat protein
MNNFYIFVSINIISKLKIMNKRLLLFLLGVAFAFQVSNIKAQGLEAIADKQYELEAYELAIDNYKKVLVKEPANSNAMFNLAECYRLSNNYTEALNWYDQLTTLENFDNRAYLHYGHILKTTGDLDNAKYWYLKYSESDQKTGNDFAASCDVAKVLLEEEDKYQIELFEGNSESSDFAMTFNRDEMVFCSFREDIKTGLAKNKSLLRSQGNQIFTIKDEKITLMRSSMRSSYHIGPISYSDKGGIVTYTKNNFKDGIKFVRNDDANMSLFLADIEEGSNDFTKERPFPYNETGFSTGFGHLNSKGDLLYFASNKPGGFGGYDLYMSQFKEGAWSQPVNLGPNVNTAGNEITPFFSEEDNFLFFASDYRAGLGGFDNFIAERISALEYDVAINLGKGINSPSDDYYFTIAPNSGKFYFTSNRMGGEGEDDIYMASPLEMEEVVSEEAIPAAVDLDNLAVTETVKNSDNTVLASDPAFYLADNNFSMEDARLLAKSNLILSAPPSKVYYIQVASLSKTQGNVGMFKKLTSLGNLYKVHKSSATKIRLGYYYEKNEAAKILSSVKGMGYNDAFIVHEPLLTSELELVGDAKNGNSIGDFSSNFRPAKEVSNYKVRLASYTDPLWFDISRVNDLGEIEQWTKGQYTIFILSGYGNLDNAQTAMIKAKNRGFTEAHIVRDNNGYLEKLKEN